MPGAASWGSVDGMPMLQLVAGCLPNLAVTPWGRRKHLQLMGCRQASVQRDRHQAQGALRPPQLAGLLLQQGDCALALLLPCSRMKGV